MEGAPLRLTTVHRAALYYCRPGYLRRADVLLPGPGAFRRTTSLAARRRSGAAGSCSRRGGPGRHVAWVEHFRGGDRVVGGGTSGGGGPGCRPGRAADGSAQRRHPCSSADRRGRPTPPAGPAGAPAATGRRRADAPVRPHPGWPGRRGPARSRPARPARPAADRRRWTRAPGRAAMPAAPLRSAASRARRRRRRCGSNSTTTCASSCTATRHRPRTSTLRVVTPSRPAVPTSASATM